MTLRLPVGRWLATAILFCLAAHVLPVSAQGLGPSVGGVAQVETALIADLESWLDDNSDYPRRMRPPRIRWISLEFARSLTETQPSSHGKKPRGLYDAETETIWLVRPWSAHDPHDVSTLLHELVHHRQATAGHWYCAGAQELPAYRLQAQWLAARGLKPRVNWIAVVLESGCTPRDIHPD